MDDRRRFERPRVGHNHRGVRAYVMRQMLLSGARTSTSRGFLLALIRDRLQGFELRQKIRVAMRRRPPRLKAVAAAQLELFAGKAENGAP